MFTSLKNKIREETGSEVPTHYSQRVSRISRGGSGSIDSFNTDYSDIKEEVQKLQTQLNRERDEWAIERDVLLGENKSLEDKLKFLHDQQNRLCSDQDEKELLEGLQAQELAKVKHLLLSQEHELAERSSSLQAAVLQVSHLQTEVSRLRRTESQLATVQDELEEIRHSSQSENAKLISQLAKTTEQVRHLEAKVQMLQNRLDTQGGQGAPEGSAAQALITERNMIEMKLEEAHLHLQDIKSSWSAKITTLETQVGRLSRQTAEESCERRAAITDRDELATCLEKVETELQTAKAQIIAKDKLVKRLETDADELNKIIKNMQNYKAEELELLQEQITQSTTHQEEQQKRMERLEDQIKTIEAVLVKERCDKEEALLRNAQISQREELCRQEIRCMEVEYSEMRAQYDRSQSELNQSKKRIMEIQEKLSQSQAKTMELEIDLKEEQKKIYAIESACTNKHEDDEDILTKYNLLEQKVRELEVHHKDTMVLQDQLGEKNKTIKILNQRLTDLRKTLQQELKQSVDASSNHDQHQHKETTNYRAASNGPGPVLDEVNFKYLRHVIVKFLTSREVEARHLTRAVATLLRLSPEEERLLQETLDWRMSWFGARPDSGSGQSARAIPPS